MRTYLEFASRNWVLAASFIGTLVLAAGVFPLLPVYDSMFDLRDSYTFDEAMKLMEGYGESGRGIYAWASPTLDTLFPILYVTFFAGLIYHLRPTNSLWVLAFLPVLAGLVDLGENLQITAMLLSYPDVSKTLVASASTFTQIKSLLGLIYQSIALVLIVFAAARVVIRRLRRT